MSPFFRADRISGALLLYRSLEDLNVDGSVRLPEQDGEIETGGPAADDGHLHRPTASVSRSSSAESETVGKSTSSSHPASS